MPDDDGTEAANPPKIVVATEPTELIVSEGKPSFKPVAGADGDLLAMDNTESDVLLDVPTQNYYVLLSGRWFRSKTLARRSLDVRAARRAPRDASRRSRRTPTSATCARACPARTRPRTPSSTPRSRRRRPSSAPTRGSTCSTTASRSSSRSRARGPSTRSTRRPPFSRIRGRYYACENAVWYVADSPDGPVAPRGLRFPTDDVDQIPPSVPVYNVKYVRIYDSTPDVVYVRLHAGLRRRLPLGRHRRVGHGLVLPAVDRADVLVAAPLHVGLPRALHAVVRMGLRRLVELPVLQRELRLGRLVPPGRLGTAALRRRWGGGWRGGTAAGAGSGPAAIGRRPSSRTTTGAIAPAAFARPAGTPSAGGGAGPARSRRTAGARRASGDRLPSAREGHPPRKIQNNIYNRLPGHVARHSETPVASTRPGPRSAGRTTCTPTGTARSTAGRRKAGSSATNDTWRSSAAAPRGLRRLGNARGKTARRPASPVDDAPAPTPAARRAHARPARAAPGAGARLLGRQRGEARAQSWSQPGAQQARRPAAARPAPQQAPAAPPRGIAAPRPQQPRSATTKQKR